MSTTKRDPIGTAAGAAGAVAATWFFTNNNPISGLICSAMAAATMMDSAKYAELLKDK